MMAFIGPLLPSNKTFGQPSQQTERPDSKPAKKDTECAGEILKLLTKPDKLKSHQEHLRAGRWKWEESKSLTGVVIFGLPFRDESSRKLLARVEQILSEKLSLKFVKPTKARQYEPTHEDGTAPVRVTLEDAGAVRAILSRTYLLRGSEIFIREDLNAEGLEIRKHLLAERTKLMARKKRIRVQSYNRMIVDGVLYESDGKQLKAIPHSRNTR